MDDIYREILPIPEKKFGGTTGRLPKDSQPDKPQINYPPEGAPNVVVVLLDDVGFGASDVFGVVWSSSDGSHCDASPPMKP